MKCVDCGKSVSNWPSWLENTRIEVRCDRCANGQPATLNTPRKHEEEHEPVQAAAG